MAEKVIICPTDFSSASDSALEYAAQLAKERGAKLVILHVEEPPIVYAAGELYYGPPEPDRAAQEKMLQAIRPKSADPDIEHRFLSGTPAEGIVGAAAETGAELIVMSSHGRTGLSRLLLGSVAEVVVRKSPCPVLILKNPGKH